MKNIILVIGIAVFLLCGWIFFEYKQVAGEAEAQVEKDITWLRLGFNELDQVASESLINKKHLETQLMQQSVNDENLFIRHYRSLFIQDGKRSCLETLVSYENRQSNVETQRWLNDEVSCTQ